MVDCEGVSLGSSCAKLPHSHSAEISKTPPPGAPKNPGKMLAIRVHMLDDNVTLFQVQAKALGRVLFEQVCKQLNLLEADYFGLEYQDHSGTKYWLDVEKPLSRQVGLSLFEPTLYFCVKFYTPDPAQLEEEYTRYLFCLQIKRDLAQGHIQCNDNTAALLASYIVQAECGDYVAEDYPDASYLSSYKFVQHQDRELEKKIMENHKKHAGQSPAEADLNLLETARRCELYGMKMHAVKDHEGVPLNLAVAHMGIVVFQGYTKIYTFSWAKIRKISFKRKKFLIKLHPDGYGYYKDTVEFFFESRNECKNLWKKCVENHGFFRCNSIKRVPRQRTRVLSRGSSFRYSGKTQKQMVEFVRENYVKRQNFQRSQSFRQSSSVHSSVATNVGGSISAHPLIPLGDNSIVSASCGSMVLAGVDSPSRTSPVDRMNQSHSSPHTFRDQRQRTGLHHSYKQYNTTSSQTDIVDFVEQIEAEPEVHTPIFTWHRSASCKELRKPQEPVEIEKPQAKYERNFIIAGSKTPSLDRSGIEQDAKVYSSSYPGTTSSLSTESADEIEPGGSVLVMDTGSSREFSHDDLSHDSYELLEREAKSYVHSRSCSLGSSGEVLPDDEIFVIEDYKDDVEKRLGYVEPRYRDIGFNEFNEKCKLGFARNREKNVEFDEFDAKCKPGAVIGYEEVERYPVERTKSEPYVSDFWKVARQHRKLFHQKSFDYTPTESIDSSEDRGQASKSTADIPYTLYKRQQMNGTSSIYECRSPVSPRKSPDKRLTVEPEKKKSVKTKNKLSKTKQDSDLNSQDSGLSLSLGAESVDDLVDQNSKNNALNLKPEGKYGGLKEEVPKAPRISSVKKDLLKVKSEDGPRTKGVLVKSKALSADSDLRKTPSFERNPPVEVIKIDSQDGEGIVICSSDDKNISVDTSDPDVIIVEYKTSRKRAFQKRGSSDSKNSIEKKVSSFDSQRSDSDTGRRRDKLRDWKSESSSSCDLPERIDFRRERFSKEIKTSIEGKVVRESKEERELKKQRSEEIERKKAEKLIKSKSESLDRTMDRDTKVPERSSLKALIDFKTQGYCTCDHDTSFEKQRSFEKKGKSMEALIENKDEHQESEVGKESNDKTSIKPVVVSKEQKTIVEINKEHILKENLPRREIDSETNDENDDVFLDVKKSDVTMNKGPRKELKDVPTSKVSGKEIKDVPTSKESGKELKDVPINKGTGKESKDVPTNKMTAKELKGAEKNIISSSSNKIDASVQHHSFEKKALSGTRSGKIDEQVLTLDSKHDTKRKLDKKPKPDWNLISSEVIIIEKDIVIIEKDKKNLHQEKEIFPSTKTKVPTDLPLEPQLPILPEKVSPQDEKDDVSKNAKDSKSEKQDMTKQVTSPEMVWKKFGELTPIAKRERSPVLFARLGFSEGSAFSPTHSQSPASSRRAKSLDAPVVSLHRLPPITSFSSKDDTLDNDEGIELEEKSLRGLKPIQKEYVIEEEELNNISPVVQNTPVNLDGTKKDELESTPQNSVPITENLENTKVDNDLSTNSSETLPSNAEICQGISEHRPGSQVPSPLIINDKPTSESINTDDDTKSSPCTVAEISPDFNKISPIDKTSLNFMDLSDQDQALPEPKKLHSHLLKDMDKLSNASDEQKVPESDFYYESPRKPSDSSQFKYDDLEFVECEQQLDSEGSIRSPADNVVHKQELLSPSKVISEETQLAHMSEESVQLLSPDPVRKRSGSDILESDINEPSTERRPSTRQERLDSFKNTKSYSVDIWTSEETDVPGIPTVDIEEVDWGNDDDAFAPDPIEALKEHMSPKDISFSEKDKEIFNVPDNCNDKDNLSSEEMFEECEESNTPINVPEESVTNKEAELIVVKTESSLQVVEDIIPLSEICEKIEEPPQVDTKLIPPKRSFDEDASSSSSIKPEKNSWVPFSLESSGSSSLEEGIFPPDDCSHFADEEEGSSNSTKEEYQGFGYSVVGAESIIGSYTGGVFGLSRTLSRISERSTTSEQERSDLEDDLSTKPSSRSLSVEDESLMSSDRQPSLSSDPSTNPEIEEHPLPPLPPEPLGFKIPPPLLNPEDEWPSPPNSSFETPIISNVEAYFMEFKPEEATKVVIPREVKQFDSSSDSDYENKTLQDDAPESSTVETTVKLAVKHKRQTNSSDTSLGVSDFSSSTSTVKLQYYSCTVKSDDSSLAEFGSSLSTEMLASSRKNSDDSVCLRRRSYHAPQRSFDDYDSPYSESDESSRHQKRNYMNLPSPTSGGSGSLTPKKGMKQERRKEERRPGVKSIARSKCYSYYSLARSPPSDGSSSSLEMGEPPTTPNTIPRVSKRRRHVPPSKRRHRASADIDIRDGHLISVSSPSVVAYGKCHVAVVEVEDNRANSPTDKKLLNNTPNHKYNNINVITSTPKVNGVSNSSNSELNSPELSPLKTLKEDSQRIQGSGDTLDGEVKKKKVTTDRAYFIAKEMMMTERTYRKDLEVINLWLRDEFDKVEEKSITELLRIIDPLHDAHCAILKEIEMRYGASETRNANQHHIADILLSATQYIPIYEDYLHEHLDVLVQLSKDLCNDAFEQTYTNFEKNKICYLPLTLFILKPIQRILHYAQLIDRLKKHYGYDHPDFGDCEEAATKFADLVKQIPEVLQKSENLVQLIELGRDLSGFEGTLTEGDRLFIRQGCLAKFSQKKGFQQRMFFLLSDMVLYSNLCGQTFRVHGQMPVKSLTVQEREDNPTPNSFFIYSGNRAITVGANSPEEKDKWLEDLTSAIDKAKKNSLNTSLLSLKCSSSSDDVTEKTGNEEVVRAIPQRSNTTVHVCWHRNTSISLADQIRAAQNQLSGYLLRKFKNSNGWQKLWVVFTNFCLFFYKTYQDDAPLASLPLLGYSVTTPLEKDNINKDFVFKLQFKNHIYFFRAESEYTFSRWMEVIGSATQHSGRIRLFSRKESTLERS